VVVLDMPVKVEMVARVVRAINMERVHQVVLQEVQGVLDSKVDHDTAMQTTDDRVP
jgi:hypothetical protein